MEEGSLRCDANVSVRPAGDDGVRHQGRAQEPELVPARAARARIRDRAADRGRRQAAARVVQETRLGMSAAGRTRVDAQQGRGARLPLLPGAGPAAARRRSGLDRGDPRALPELPDARRRRFVAQYALPEYDAGVLTQSPALADYFEATAAASGNPKAASNWIMGDLTRKMNELGVEVADVAADAGALAGLIRLDRLGHDQPGRSPRTCSRRCTRSGRRRRRDRRGRGAGAHRRRRRAIEARVARRDRAPTQTAGGAVPRRQAADLRVPRRAGDEGDEGQGESGAGQRRC